MAEARRLRPGIGRENPPPLCRAGKAISQPQWVESSATVPEAFSAEFLIRISCEAPCTNLRIRCTLITGATLFAGVLAKGPASFPFGESRLISDT